MLFSFPPTRKYLNVHLSHWSLANINQRITEHRLPYVQPLDSFKRQAYVFEHNHLDTIAQFRLSNAGLGNRYPRFAGVMYQRQVSCPLCTCSSLTEAHVVFFCPAITNHREEFNLTLFRTVCQSKGFYEEETFSLYINGLDSNESYYRIQISSRLGL